MRKEVAVMSALAAVIVGLGGILLLNNKPVSIPENKISTQGSYELGPAGAKVTIVEFADFQCPACAASVATLHGVLNKYPDKVKLVFKHFPLSQHRNALAAAEAAEAAGGQGKFWEMYDLLYANQGRWENSPDPRGIFISLAEILNLDKGRFAAETERRNFAQKISADQSEGVSLNVNATPTFFINGQKFVGVPNGEFESIIEKEINK